MIWDEKNSPKKKLRFFWEYTLILFNRSAIQTAFIYFVVQMANHDNLLVEMS
jgi:hypothetical protein